jgi:Phosphoenolpyruvate-protein kinase (PTS system EI component in bacteria)
VHAGDTVIVDGLKGTILLNPSRDEKYQYTESSMEYEHYKDRISQLCQNSAETTDGHRVEVLANVGWVEEIPKSIASGAEGVGLYRTEFSFMNRTSTPSESELYKEYSDAVRALDGRGVCFRTLDLGSDKLTLSLEHLAKRIPRWA